MTSCCAPSRPAALPVAVIGAGPVGLAAAAHLLARGLRPVVFEAAPMVGAAPRDWGHVRMFSPWRYNIDLACAALLQAQGWEAPDPEAFPTGQDLAERYLAPLAAVPEIAACLRLGTRVTGVARAGLGKVRNAGRQALPFDLRFTGPDGQPGRLLAQAVVVASGTWANPAPAGAGGLPALGEADAAPQIRTGMPDILGAERARYDGKRVLVVGAGDSALGNLLALAELGGGTRIAWATRSVDLSRSLGGGEADQLPQRGALGSRARALVQQGRVELLTGFAVDAILRHPDGSLLVQAADGRTATTDELVVATGLRPDLAFLREARLDLDPALECPRVLAPLIDPNLHSCGTVRPHGAEELAQPDAGLFLAGMVSYGRAPTFLLMTGYEQVRSIAAWLAGDLDAARRVELVLPETGVCCGTGLDAPAEAAACCAPKAEPAEAACCIPSTPQGVCCPPKPELPAGAPCCGVPATAEA